MTWYSDRQTRLLNALNAHFSDTSETWKEVVDATNDLTEAIERKEEYYDASFPPEVERKIDHGAQQTAWIYMRLESAAKSKRKTARRIKRAMGYNV